MTYNIQSDFEKVKCDECFTLRDGYYSLSNLTKALYVKCPKCGVHAITFREGLRLPWKPSKAFIKDVGTEEARRIVDDLQKSGKMHVPRVPNSSIDKNNLVTLPLFGTSRASPETLLYSDAGTRNNGQKGKQETLVVICDNQGKIICERWIGDFSNNEGEITGIIICLSEFSKGKSIEVRTDSKIAANWTMRGWTKLNEKSLAKGVLTTRHRDLIYEAHDLFKKTSSVITWIPRELNLAGHYIEETQGL